MNLRIVILSAKVLSNGEHRIRIAMSHNGDTRYFMTRFVVPKDKCIKNGVVVGVDNAPYINQKLRDMMNDIYRAFDEIEDAEYYTCAQIVDIINHRKNSVRVNTFKQAGEEWLSIQRKRCKENTIRLNEEAVNSFVEFTSDTYLLRNIDNKLLYDYRDYLANDKGYSDTTIAFRFQGLHSVIQYAKDYKYVKYDTDPFKKFTLPKPVARKVALPVEALRAIRDMKSDSKEILAARDLFMLSFYLCGMNLVDMYSMDLRKESVSFIRNKNQSRKDPNDITEFEIQPEARALIEKYTNKEGKLQFLNRKTFTSIKSLTDINMSKIKAQLNIEQRLIFYSARKTFSQIGNELMIKDSIIEYCLGDSVSSPRRTLSFYIQVTPKMANSAIRKIFDFVASNKSIEEYDIE